MTTFTGNINEGAIEQFLTNELTKPGNFIPTEVTGCKIVNQATAYVAVNCHPFWMVPWTKAFIIRLKFDNPAPLAFSFEVVDESSDRGPEETKCPASILKLLTPLLDEYKRKRMIPPEWALSAQRWRDGCQANILKEIKDHDDK